MATHRYWNQSMAVGVYSSAALTPLSGAYVVTRHPMKAGRCHTLVKVPIQHTAHHLMADALQSIVVRNASALLPTRPCFAAFPPIAPKRKRGALTKKKEGLQDDEFHRTLHIRLRPDATQGKALRECFAAKRLYYNHHTRHLINSRAAGTPHNYCELRTLVNTTLMVEQPWVCGVLSMIRAQASAAAEASLNDNLAKAKANPAHRFRLGFQSLRRLDITPTEVITFDPPGSGGSNSMLKGFFGAPLTIRSGASERRRVDFYCKFSGNVDSLVRAVDSAPVVQRLLVMRNSPHQSSILWDKRTRRFHLRITEVVKRGDDTRPREQREIVAFDPGARKFNSFYRPDGTHGELVCGAKANMERLARKCAEYQRRRDLSSTGPERRKWRGRMLRANARLRNWIKNCHYEAIKAAFALGDFMVLPIFGTERMVRRATRVFGNDTASKLYTWSHYSFSQRMWNKVQTTPNKQMAFTREPGTSKTCDNCGHWNASLGGATIFQCGACGYRCDRDHHGARGNLLAAIGAARDTSWDGVAR